MIGLKNNIKRIKMFLKMQKYFEKDKDIFINIKEKFNQKLSEISGGSFLDETGHHQNKIIKLYSSSYYKNFYLLENVNSIEETYTLFKTKEKNIEEIMNSIKKNFLTYENLDSNEYFNTVFQFNYEFELTTYIKNRVRIKNTDLSGFCLQLYDNKYSLYFKGELSENNSYDDFKNCNRTVLGHETKRNIVSSELHFNNGKINARKIYNNVKHFPYEILYKDNKCFFTRYLKIEYEGFFREHGVKNPAALPKNSKVIDLFYLNFSE